MEETDKIDPKQLKGFNDGYLLAEYEPDLAEKLAKIEAISPWLVGMQQGRNQFIQEKMQEKLPSWLKENPVKIKKDTLNKDKDKDRDLTRE